MKHEKQEQLRRKKGNVKQCNGQSRTVDEFLKMYGFGKVSMAI